jgi:hypothetical protein
MELWCWALARSAENMQILYRLILFWRSVALWKRQSETWRVTAENALFSFLDMESKNDVKEQEDNI